MKLGLEWLAELVPLRMPVGELVALLDNSGTKVETVRRPGAGIDGVVVAEVKAIEDHPNADSLTLVEVTVDDGAAQQVVCGARNFSVGDLVPLATVGSRLPNMVVEERKIRGVISRGMLCSAAELGVSRDHSGILVLPPDAVPGSDVVAVLGLDDVVLELEVTPNRPDCMSVIGVAREVAALTGASLSLPDASESPQADLVSPVKVDVEDADACPRYVARYITGLTPGPAPAWMAARLAACGIRPISNIVDATNYVLLETGQPLHAFDAERVDEGHIVVRRAREGERLTTLDGVDRPLVTDDLLIAHAPGALALAGVMGGRASEVSGTTSAVILESAYFDPVTVGRTSRRLGLRTEASARFERGGDPEMAPWAAARAVKLLVATAGGRPAAQVVDDYHNPPERPVVVLRPQRTERVLGIGIETDRQAASLRSIGFGVEEEAASLRAVAPSWRHDIGREEDLIEEVARFAGLDILPATLPPGVSGGLTREQAADRLLRRTLAGLGVTEAWTDAFADAGELDRLGLPPGHRARRVVGIANPMTEDEAALRTTLLPGLLRSARHNLHRRAPGVALFEVASAYLPSEADLPVEVRRLGGVFAGRRAGGEWRSGEQAWDFFGAKGVVDGLVAGLGLPPLAYQPLEEMPWHPTQGAACLLDGEPIGALGELHPEVCEAFEVAPRTVGVELDLEPLWPRLPERVQVGELSPYPPTFIDLAVVVAEGVPAALVGEGIRAAGAPELTSVRLFDVYRGEQVPRGHKSLAYALELRADDRTLGGEEALAVRDRIVAELVTRAGAKLRG